MYESDAGPGHHELSALVIKSGSLQPACASCRLSFRTARFDLPSQR